MRMKQIALALLAVATIALPSTAQQPMKPERQIDTRQAAMTMIGYNFGSLSAMAHNKKPYDKDEALLNATIVANVSALPKRFFGPGTDKGHDTEALPKIWENKADFEKRMDKMHEEALKLPDVVSAGDMDAFKKQVSETGKACKSCHDEYKKKD